eukprot:Lankesteria_metandrocarpae@DN6440_c0_g1_i1.p1
MLYYWFQIKPGMFHQGVILFLKEARVLRASFVLLPNVNKCHYGTLAIWTLQRSMVVYSDCDSEPQVLPEVAAALCTSARFKGFQGEEIRNMAHVRFVTIGRGARRGFVLSFI